MTDNLQWSSGSGFAISTLASGDGAGNTAHFQRIIVQTGLVNVQGQVTAVGTMTAEMKGTITAQIANVITAESRGLVTAQVSGGWPIGVTGQVTAHGTVTAAINNVVTAESRGQITAVGTVTAEVKGTLTAQIAGIISAQGISAHDSPVGGNPVLGGKISLTGLPAAVAHGDVVYAAGDKFGRTIIRTRPFVSDWLATACPAISGITGVNVFAAQGTGTGICVTEVTVTNSNASTGTLLTLKNGGQAIHQVYLASNGGGAALNFDNNPLLISANSAFVAACDNSGQVHVAAVGYREVF